MSPTCAACCIFNLTSSCSLPDGSWKEVHLPVQARISGTRCERVKMSALSTAERITISVWIFLEVLGGRLLGHFCRKHCSGSKHAHNVAHPRLLYHLSASTGAQDTEVMMYSWAPHEYENLRGEKHSLTNLAIENATGVTWFKSREVLQYFWELYDIRTYTHWALWFAQRHKLYENKRRVFEPQNHSLLSTSRGEINKRMLLVCVLPCGSLEHLHWHEARYECAARSFFNEVNRTSLEEISDSHLLTKLLMSHMQINSSFWPCACVRILCVSIKKNLDKVKNKTRHRSHSSASVTLFLQNKVFI